MHHHAYFLSYYEFTPRRYFDQFSIKSKDFIQIGHVDWLNKLILSLDAFKEGNMVYISPNIKVDMLAKPSVLECILLGASCSPIEIS